MHKRQLATFVAGAWLAFATAGASAQSARVRIPPVPSTLTNLPALDARGEAAVEQAQRPATFAAPPPIRVPVEKPTRKPASKPYAGIRTSASCSFELKLENFSISAPAEPSERTLKYTATDNCLYAVSSDVQWAEPSMNTHGKRILLTFAENSSGAPREGSLYLATGAGPVELTLSQAGAAVKVEPPTTTAGPLTSMPPVLATAATAPTPGAEKSEATVVAEPTPAPVPVIDLVVPAPEPVIVDATPDAVPVEAAEAVEPKPTPAPVEDLVVPAPEPVAVDATPDVAPVEAAEALEPTPAPVPVEDLVVPTIAESAPAVEQVQPAHEADPARQTKSKGILSGWLDALTNRDSPTTVEPAAPAAASVTAPPEGYEEVDLSDDSV